MVTTPKQSPDKAPARPASKPPSASNSRRASTDGPAAVRRSRPGTSEPSGTSARTKAPEAKVPAPVRCESPQEQEPQSQTANFGLAEEGSAQTFLDAHAEHSCISVASGRVENGNTFFTGLRRQFSFESDSGLDFFDAQQEASSVLSAVSSRQNPMQSPSASAYFSGGEEEGAEQLLLAAERSMAGSAVFADSMNPMMTPEASNGANLGDAPATERVLDVISSLYGPESGAAITAAAAGTANDTAGLLADTAAARTSENPAGSMEDARAEQSEPEAAAAMADDADSRELSTGAEVGKEQSVRSSLPATLVPADSPADSEREQQGQHEEQQEKQQTQQQEQGARASMYWSRQPEVPTTQAEQQQAQQQHMTHEQQLQEQQEDETRLQQELQGSPEPSASHLEVNDAPYTSSSSQPTYITQALDTETSRASIAAMDSKFEARQAMQAELTELGSYMQELVGRRDEAGEKLVELPRNYLALVEGMLRDRRAEFKALQGWAGPHRFEDLPINAIATDHPDPAIAEGLARIKQLDTRLREVTLDALAAAREVAPEAWAEGERRRLAARAAALEVALAKEREKRLQGGALVRALRGLEPGQQGRSTYGRYYMLEPSEEALLEAVLQRDESALAQSNPFETPSDAAVGPGVQLVSAAGAHAAGYALPWALWSSPSEALKTERSAAGAAGAGAGVDVNGSGGGALTCEDSNATANGSDGSSNHPDTRISSSDNGATIADADATQQDGALAGQPQEETPSAAATVRATCEDEMSQHQGLRCTTLAEIDAALEEFALEHSWDEHGSLLDFNGAGSQVSLGFHPHVPAPAPAITSSTRAASIIAAKDDYIREQRLAKELAQREREIDAQLRALRCGELPERLSEEALRALVAECTRQQAATAESRRTSQMDAGSMAGDAASDAGTAAADGGERLVASAGSRRASAGGDGAGAAGVGVSGSAGAVKRQVSSSAGSTRQGKASDDGSSRGTTSIKAGRGMATAATAPVTAKASAAGAAAKAAGAPPKVAGATGTTVAAKSQAGPAGRLSTPPVVAAAAAAAGKGGAGGVARSATSAASRGTSAK